MIQIHQRIFLLSFLLILSNFLFSQEKTDYQWIFGHGDDTTSNVLTQFSFLGDSLSVSQVSISSNFDVEASNTSISDANGNLLFYSNGCHIFNSNHVIMENGDSIGSQRVLDEYCNPAGSPFTQGIISMPHPGNSNQYYLIYHRYESVNYLTISAPASTGLYYSLVDMSLNNGMGKVLEKNVVFFQDTLTNFNLKVVKHADNNGWWILVPELLSNCYYKFSLSTFGLNYISKQCIGKVYPRFGSQAVFSPNGEKYIINRDSFINIFDFNRCDGSLSNPETIYHFSQGDYTPFGASISPNSRFLYMSNLLELFQYDLTASDIENSGVLIDTYDGQPFPNYGPFLLQQLAPDGKVYIAGGSSHTHIHVIHEPDSLGLACNFEQHGVSIPTYNIASIPSFLTYRMEPTVCVPEGDLEVEAFVLHPSCYGESDGKIILEINGGVAPYQIDWFNSDFTGTMVDSVPEGTFGVYIIDSQMDTAIAVAELYDPEPLTVNITSTPTFENDNIGTATAHVFGGTDPYLYVWGTLPVQDTETAINLAAGTYPVLVVDDNGCTGVQTAYVGVITSSEDLMEVVSRFDIFPNPSNGLSLLELNVKEPSNITIEIYDDLGRLIDVFYKNQRLVGELNRNIPDLQSGIYFVVVKIENGILTKKIIIN